MRTDQRGRVWVAVFNAEQNISAIGQFTPAGPDKPVWEISGEVTSLAISQDSTAF